MTQAQLLFDAAQEPKELWLLPGVRHCGAYFADRPTYCTRVATFFDRWLPHGATVQTTSRGTYAVNSQASKASA